MHYFMTDKQNQYKQQDPFAWHYSYSLISHSDICQDVNIKAKARDSSLSPSRKRLFKTPLKVPASTRMTRNTICIHYQSRNLL